MKHSATYWVLKDKNSNIYYSECYHLKYGKIQTTCSNISVAKKFRTRNMAESKAFNKYENFIAVKGEKNVKDN